MNNDYKEKYALQRVAKFEKVSFDRFRKDWIDTFGSKDDNEDGIKRIFEGINLPKRATKGSAGYDFYSPVDFTLRPGETIKLPTGIRISIDDGYMCMIFPRSGLGFKYRLQLNNTVGIIDSDYYFSDNEGHVFIKLTNDSNEGKELNIKAGDAFAQGIFTAFGITIDDKTEDIRNGGFGSTDNQNQRGSGK